MVVLSLFDGIGCGRLALKRAGIPVDAYYASEVSASAITIAKKNFPDIIEVGNVMRVHYNAETGVLYTDVGALEVGRIDMLLGGSPCTDFSSIGYTRGMTTGEENVTDLEQYLALKNSGVIFKGESFLFWEYVRLLCEIHPRYFLLENVVMAEEWQSIINRAVGCAPVKLNSSLFSAQNRPRLYWTNIAGVEVPEDKGIKLDDIFDENASTEDVSEVASIKACFADLYAHLGCIPERFNAYNLSRITDKACALTRGSMVTSSCATLLFVPVEDGVCEVRNGLLFGKYETPLADGRYNLRRLSLLEMERLQTLPDGYTEALAVTRQRRGEAIGNCWTVDVIVYILSRLFSDNYSETEEW